MNVSSYVFEEVYPLSLTALSSTFTPYHLWAYYMQYLWNYEPSSWVAQIALVYKVFAFLLVLPLAILGKLDVSSYVVARTLGVVDVVKASTEAPIDHLSARSKSRGGGKSRSRDPPRLLRDSPDIVVTSPPRTPLTPRFRAGASDTDEGDVHTPTGTPPSESEMGHSNMIVSDEEADGLAELSGLDQSIFSNEQLAGVGVFSPAASRPASPTLSRFKPLPHTPNGQVSEKAASVRRRRKRTLPGECVGSSTRGSSEEGI